MATADFPHDYINKKAQFSQLKSRQQFPLSNYLASAAPVRRVLMPVPVSSSPFVITRPELLRHLFQGLELQRTSTMNGKN